MDVIESPLLISFTKDRRCLPRGALNIRARLDDVLVPSAAHGDVLNSESLKLGQHILHVIPYSFKIVPLDTSSTVRRLNEFVKRF